MNKSERSGYALVRMNGKQKASHIRMAEMAIGRPLKFLSNGNPNNEVVHHINGVKRDNRPDNLLVCTQRYHMELHHRLEASDQWPPFQRRNLSPSGNSRPTSKARFKGVSAHGGKWQAFAVIHGKHSHLGTFASPEEAAHAYDQFVLENRGPHWISNKSLGLLP